MVRKEVLDRVGAKLVDVVDRVSASLHTSDLTELNRQVGIEGAKPAQVAADWLRRRWLA